MIVSFGERVRQLWDKGVASTRYSPIATETVVRVNKAWDERTRHFNKSLKTSI